MGHPARFLSVNGQRIKRYRVALGWTQAELANKAGYSERLIRKAEAGGSLSMETIADLAEALSSFKEAVLAEHLLSDDHLAMAKQFVEGYDTHGKDMVTYYAHLFSDNLIVNCPADPQQVPFAGTWHGIAGFQDFLNQFFSVFDRKHQSLSPVYMVGDGRVTARYDDQLIFRGIALPAFWVNLHFHFENGLIVQIDDEFDTKNAAHFLDVAMSQISNGSRTV